MKTLSENAPAPLLDRRLYPDVPVPTSHETDLDNADYLDRFGATRDFGLVPSG